MIKIECFDGRPHENGTHFRDCEMYYPVQAVLKELENLCSCKNLNDGTVYLVKGEYMCAFCYFKNKLENWRKRDEDL